MVFVFTSFGFILGVILGSFAKALADRSLTNKSFWGRSFCPKCKKKLSWIDLIPIFSYIFLKGRCRLCKKKIEVSYLLVEVIMGLIIGYLFFVSFVWFPGFNDFLALSLFIFDIGFKTFFVTVLVTITLTDLKMYFIPDRVIIPALKIAALALFIISVLRVWNLYFFLTQSPFGRFLLPPQSSYFWYHAVEKIQPFYSGVTSGVLIGLFFFLLIIVTRGKGMGGGDVKLGAFIGLSLGLTSGILAIILGFFIGALVSITLVIFGKKRFKEVVPFGPFLVLGSLISLFWGNNIFNWYLNAL